TQCPSPSARASGRATSGAPQLTPSRSRNTPRPRSSTRGASTSPGSPTPSRAAAGSRAGPSRPSSSRTDTPRGPPRPRTFRAQALNIRRASPRRSAYFVLVPSAATITLRTPVSAIPGIGPRRVDALRDLGVRNVAHLLAHLPFRHEFEAGEAKLADLQPGGVITARGEVTA